MSTLEPTKKSRNDKHATSDSSSRKRRREEQSTTEAPSSSKKQRKAATSSHAASSTSESNLSKSASRSNSSVKSKPKPKSKPRAKNAESPFVEQTISFYLPLSPISNDFAIQGLCAEHVSPLLLTYYPPVDGFLLSYGNPRLSNDAHSGAVRVPTPAPADANTHAQDAESTTLSCANDEYGVTLIWLTIDAVILRPSRDTVIEGHVRLQNENYISLVCCNFFNAVIRRRRLPGDWNWVDGTEGVPTALAASVSDAVSGAVTSTNPASKAKAVREHGVVADSETSSVVSSTSDSDSDADVTGKAPQSAQAAQPESTNDMTARTNAESREAQNDTLGHFTSKDGTRISSLQRFKIINYECAPSNERERGFISLEGSLLTDDEDRAVDEAIILEFKEAAGRGRKGRS